jgi:hypothetical protein
MKYIISLISLSGESIGKYLEPSVHPPMALGTYSSGLLFFCKASEK